MTAIDAALIAAYRMTNYVVFEDRRETIIRVGDIDSEVDALFHRHGAGRGTIITAWNPQSIVLSDAENAMREAELWRWIADRQLLALPVEGRDPSGSWESEQSCLIFDIAVDVVEALARHYDQNAIVHIERGQAPELALLR